MSERQILFVLGMHRSGTSALCSALERCGVSFGSNLLASMAGVNESGFWEDADVVDLNQQVLARLGFSWFNPPSASGDLQSSDLEDLAASIKALVERGFGDSSLQALKDPRLCITLPLWQQACQLLQLPSHACVINRAPLEVASSLQERDGFPLGYGLRLYARYRRMMEPYLPADTVYVTYDELLRDTAGVMRALADVLPLKIPADGLGSVVRSDLRHFQQDSGDSILSIPGSGPMDLDRLDEAIAREFPLEKASLQFADGLVERGDKLSRLGEEHAEALATLEQRDVDIDHLSQLHKKAIATIAERDEQISEFDRKLADTGSHLGQALENLNERDQQLEEKVREIHAWEDSHQRMRETPVLGKLFSRMWFREQR